MATTATKTLHGVTVSYSFVKKALQAAHLVFIYEAGPCGHYVPKRVTNAGTIRFKRRLLFIANSLKQQVVGLEEVDDGIWSIYFCNVLLARVDERDYVIRP